MASNMTLPSRLIFSDPCALQLSQYYHRTGKWDNMERSNLWSLRLGQVESAAKSIVHRLEEEEGPVSGARTTTSTMSAEDWQHVDNMIGKGAFGEVYLVDHCGVNAAAKVINVPWTGDHELHKQQQVIAKECSTIKNLQGSEHVVTLLDDTVHDKKQFIVFTKFLPGGDLRTSLNVAKEAGFMEEKLQKSVIMDVVAGMKHIHANHVIHGDLKSPNVMMDSHGRAKVSAKANA
ncbi:unnamed protein product [Choristocarpus tenellus]